MLFDESSRSKKRWIERDVEDQTAFISFQMADCLVEILVDLLILPVVLLFTGISRRKKKDEKCMSYKRQETERMSKAKGTIG